MDDNKLRIKKFLPFPKADLFELYELDILEYFKGDAEVYLEIINDNAFERLKDIKLLGALDYLFRRKGAPDSNNQSRYQHSLGVATLALYYSKLLKLSIEDEQLIVIAALLHDIGHSPLSHSLEPQFILHFKLDHHKAGELIIRGRAPITTRINSILKNHNISVDEVNALINGNSKSEHAFLFNSKFNIDTIDGILRSYDFLAKKPSNLNRYEVLTQIIGKKLTLKNLKIMDNFWKIKNVVYRDYIFGERNYLADLSVQKYMEMHIKQFKFEDYFLNETELSKQHPSLFKFMTASPGKTTTSHNQRWYVIDKGQIIDDVDKIPKRYKSALYRPPLGDIV